MPSEQRSAQANIRSGPAPSTGKKIVLGNKSAIVIIGALFFIFGFVTWLNGPLITYVQLAFEFTVFKAFLVTFVFYL